MDSGQAILFRPNFSSLPMIASQVTQALTFIFFIWKNGDASFAVGSEEEWCPRWSLRDNLWPSQLSPSTGSQVRGSEDWERKTDKIITQLQPTLRLKQVYVSPACFYIILSTSKTHGQFLGQRRSSKQGGHMRQWSSKVAKPTTTVSNILTWACFLVRANDRCQTPRGGTRSSQHID